MKITLGSIEIEEGEIADLVVVLGNPVENRSLLKDSSHIFSIIQEIQERRGFKTDACGRSSEESRVIPTQG